MKTTDLTIAAFLTASDFPLQDLEVSGNRVVFVFGPGAKERALAVTRGAHVPAALFAAKLREMRSLVATKMFEGEK